MLIATKAVVVSSIKYGDHGLIVKCFTRKEGLKTYLLQGILKKKKGKINKAYFLPLSILQINASHNNKGSLNRISEAKIEQPFTTLHTDVLKQSIVFFLSDLLTSVLQEEEGENTVLFDFLEHAIVWLDHHDQVANFHLKFLIELTKCLGFYPSVHQKLNSHYFDLLEGRYVAQQGLHVISGNSLALFNKALGIKFDTLEKELFGKKQRAHILELLLTYYQLHMPTFRKPKSLDILSKVLE